jgi:hypothetical protein
MSKNLDSRRATDDDENRDPEDRPVHDRSELREKMLDKTIADSFPTSDPPSTIPDPSADDSLAASSAGWL